MLATMPDDAPTPPEHVPFDPVCKQSRLAAFCELCIRAAVASIREPEPEATPPTSPPFNRALVDRGLAKIRALTTQVAEELDRDEPWPDALIEIQDIAGLLRELTSPLDRSELVGLLEESHGLGEDAACDERL
jgi:hypothetical protein